MASIVIQDLPESSELDRQAMQAIAGGSRLGAHPGTGAGAANAVRAGTRRMRLFDLAPGKAARQAAPHSPAR